MRNARTAINHTRALEKWVQGGRQESVVLENANTSECLRPQRRQETHTSSSKNNLRRKRMTAEMTKQQDGLTGSELEKLVVGGDLSGLPPEAKARHYLSVCSALGLNPSTKPLAYLRLNNKEVLYALKDATDQLRKINSVSITISSRDRIDDVYVVTARASLPSGRVDESTGAVSVGGLKGEALANAFLKAETKAKRRVTLSIVGLGMLDESELDTIPSGAFDRLKAEVSKAPNVVARLPEKKSEALPPAPIDYEAALMMEVPPAILLSTPALSEAKDLHGVLVGAMSLEQAELLSGEMHALYKKFGSGAKVSENGMNWVSCLLSAAEQRVLELGGES